MENSALMEKYEMPDIPRWLNIILIGMTEYQKTANYCEHSSQCKLRTLIIEHPDYDEDPGNTEKAPFINYCYNETVKNLKYIMIPKIIENVFASMVNLEDIEFVFCVVKYEKKDHAVCKFKGFPYLAFMSLEPVKTCKAFQEYMTNLRAFLDMLLWFNEILKVKEERLKKIEARERKHKIFRNRIANLRAEKRFIYLQILVGFGLSTDPAGTKARELLDLAHHQWDENDISVSWFNKCVKNFDSKLWSIKDGKCFGIQFVESDITVSNCLGQESGENKSKKGLAKDDDTKIENITTKE